MERVSVTGLEVNYPTWPKLGIEVIPDPNVPVSIQGRYMNYHYI